MWLAQSRRILLTSARSPAESMLLSLIIMIRGKNPVCETQIHASCPFHLLFDPCRVCIVGKENFAPHSNPISNRHQGRPLARSSSGLSQPHLPESSKPLPLSLLSCSLISLNRNPRPLLKSFRKYSISPKKISNRAVRPCTTTIQHSIDLRPKQAWTSNLQLKFPVANKNLGIPMLCGTFSKLSLRLRATCCLVHGCWKRRQK